MREQHWDGHNGFVVPAGDAIALATAIESLARDSNRRDRMAQASYEATRSWTWSTVAQKHSQVLHELSERV